MRGVLTVTNQFVLFRLRSFDRPVDGRQTQRAGPRTGRTSLLVRGASPTIVKLPWLLPPHDFPEDSELIAVPRALLSQFEP